MKFLNWLGKTHNKNYIHVIFVITRKFCSPKGKQNFLSLLLPRIRAGLFLSVFTERIQRFEFHESLLVLCDPDNGYQFQFALQSFVQAL